MDVASTTPEEFKVTSPESLGKVKPIYSKDGRRRGATDDATHRRNKDNFVLFLAGSEVVPSRALLPVLSATRKAGEAEG